MRKIVGNISKPRQQFFYCFQIPLPEQYLEMTTLFLAYSALTSQKKHMQIQEN